MADVEKSAGQNNGENTANNYDLTTNDNRDEALERIRATGSLSISPELFEKIYLSPKNTVKGDLRAILGNPTPLGLAGFLLSLSPLSTELLGWRGAGGGGAATVGVFYFSGGLLLTISAVLEFILGNTFIFVVFGSYGAFFLSLAATLTPAYGASTAYDPTDPLNPGFHASFAFYFLFIGLLTFFFFLASLRTNVAFVTILFTLTIGFEALAGAYWQLANGNAHLANRLQITGGAFTFVTILAGWYLILVQILAAVDFPLALPVGDLSHIIKGRSDKGEKAQ
ncbi:hypothetical protein VTN77DRAFT_9848 [Rasamsonia byssochlamydoides]|uniref:uncharacterized protein n=1 Tax=Rasamsonia byssochlamydoides TaxID=89139 RepID=UPI00374303F9